MIEVGPIRPLKKGKRALYLALALMLLGIEVVGGRDPARALGD
jgi:hypothetical protein